MIYLPHPLEWHPDHQAAWPVLRDAWRGCANSPPELRSYEVWTPLTQPHHVENITAVMPRKLRALRAHRSQLEEFDYERAVRGLNQFRGELADVEPFSAEQLEKTMHAFVEQHGSKIGDIVHAVRVAVTGKAVGFGLFDTLAILGRDRCLARIDRALALAAT